MVKTIIFDFDGVLVDTERKGVIDNYNLLKANGVNRPNLNELLKLVGTTDTKNYEYISDTLAIDIKEAKLKLDKYIYNHPYTKELFFDGTKKVLDILHNDYLLIIASNSPLEFIYRMLDDYGVSEYFYKIYSGKDMVSPKPSPEIYNYVLKMCNLDKNECIVVEDSGIGIQSALGAGIKVIGRQNNFLNLDISKANYIINDLSELPNLLRRINNL